MLMFHMKHIGVVVIDVVEGTAMEALGSMHNIIAARPTQFPSIEVYVDAFLMLLLTPS